MRTNWKQVLDRITPLLGKYSLRDIIHQKNLNVSPQALSVQLRKDPPLSFPYHLTEYRCKICKNSWRIWKIFYGRLHRKTCPDCGGRSIQIRSTPMPDVYPQLTSDVLWKGGVISFNGTPLAQFQKKQINRIAPKYPLYVVQPQKKRQRCLHIVYIEGTGVWITHCHRKYKNEEATPINGGHSVFSAKRVCMICLNNLITYRKPEDWTPIRIKRPNGRSYNEIELIVDALLFKNIQAACKIRSLSPKVFYNAIERHTDLYYALFLRGNE